MKRYFTTGLAALLSLSCLLAGCTSAAAVADPNTVNFDFEKDDSGFAPIFADYPNSEGVEEFYEFRHEYGAIPIKGAGNGIFISANNHSDDLFMGYKKVLDGFAPGRTYRFNLSFQLATDVESGMFGVGGSPGESVIVKCGITPTEPISYVTGEGDMEQYILNIDAGIQNNSGRDMVVVGDMTKTENARPGEYEFKEFQAEFDATANVLGEVWLIIATDSGFEATTSYYLDDISVSWEDIEQPAATRALAAQMLFDTADRPSADPASCPFSDVAVTDENAEAITWAQQNGYLNGYGNGKFGPADSMTTEQAMVMIYRFFGSPEADISALNGLTGKDNISDWARDAVAWALANEILRPTKSISPQAPITVEELTYSLSQIVIANE